MPKSPTAYATDTDPYNTVLRFTPEQMFPSNVCASANITRSRIVYKSEFVLMPRVPQVYVKINDALV